MASNQSFIEGSVFDAYVMTDLTRRIIEDAYSMGNTVIVGRGGQCILADKPDVFRLFVYAPLQDRVRRIRARLPKAINAEHQLHTIDEERARYIHQRFGSNWRDTHLYDLMISSHEDEEKTARVILHAMSNEQS
jgi:cytidylate kinase